MGPEVMAAVTIGSAVLAGGATAYSAKAQSDTMKDQAEAEQKKAAVDSVWAQRKSNEELASAQSAAKEESRKADIAQSRLTALAGASGSGASDETILKLYGDIEKEGLTNSGKAMAAGQQRSDGINYQDALNRWTADSNARIKTSAANKTLIGGLLSGAGQVGTGIYSSRMAAKYGELGPVPRETGYGK